MTSRGVSFAVPALLAAGMVASTAFAGGGERLCVDGVELVEKWPGPSPGVIPWSVATGPTGSAIAPGFPESGCFAALPLDARPGLQSLIRAARTWNEAAVPCASFPSCGGPPASTFRLSETPSLVPSPTPGAPTGIAQDGTNLVTLWEPATTFTLGGGLFALAFSVVYLQPGTAQIVECDVAFAATIEVVPGSGVPVQSLVEENDAVGQVYATRTAAVGFADPTLFYTDFEGVMMHEFGHFAGLGHSLVDSRHVGSQNEFPTMATVSQMNAWSGTVRLPNGTCDANGFSQFLADGANAGVPGITGSSAKGLSMDDVSALADLYPDVAALDAATGAIAGTVTFKDATGAVIPLPGAHVVAQNVAAPDVIRVGRLSFSGGKYRIGALPPGDYHVFVETVDQPPQEGLTGYYFRNDGVPNYVFLGPTGCTLELPQDWRREFFDGASEGFDEPQGANAVAIVPVAVGAETIADFRVVAGPDGLTVRYGGETYASPRGVWRTLLGPPFPTVEFLVNQPAAPSAPVMLLLSADRVSVPLAGQLLEVSPLGAVTLNGMLDATGSATFGVPLSAAAGYSNLFAQAVSAVGSSIVASNSINVWTVSP